jgi:F-type H+-transporting ATPase subunit alpha
MAIEEQVAAIYCGVRGFLDKVDPARITEFETKFMEHVKATQRPLLDQIGKDGHLSEVNDKALHKVVVDFLATF